MSDQKIFTHVTNRSNKTYILEGVGYNRYRIRSGETIKIAGDLQASVRPNIAEQIKQDIYKGIISVNVGAETPKTASDSFGAIPQRIVGGSEDVARRLGAKVVEEVVEIQANQDIPIAEPIQEAGPSREYIKEEAIAAAAAAGELDEPVPETENPVNKEEDLALLDGGAPDIILKAPKAPAPKTGKKKK